MEYYERELLVSRIMAGYTRCVVHDKVYLVHSLDLDTNYQAQEVYADTYRKAISSDCFTDKQAYDLLIESDLWSEEKQNQLDRILPDHIEEFKVQLYESFFKTEEVKRIRKYLEVAKEELDKLSTTRSMFSHMTPEGIAATAKLRFQIENCTTLDDGLTYDWSDTTVDQIIHQYQLQGISDEQLRELSKNDPWQSTWHAHSIGGDLFCNIPLDIYQKRLISWSLLYQNIAESMEPPPQAVIDDDDMLDGWMIIQRRNREDAESKSSVEGRIGHNDKISNASEVYIPVSNVDDAKRVDRANDPLARAAKKQRFNLIQQKGKVKELEFADVRLDLQMQANQAGINKVKGK